MSLPKGSRLGPYEIVSPLGAGGMGEVYRANDTKLKRQVAIKIMPPDLATDPARLARFQREAEVLASLNHPHIAAIYGFEDSAGVHALVMELIEGPTLADRIAQGPIPLDEALPIARQIADGLEAAHERGIVHRDLKPANIKVRDDGTVKVLDFGLAKSGSTGSAGSTGSGSTGSGSSGSETLANSPTMASPAMSMAGMILGTAAYMSPEQARGKSVDKRSDVWAFGAVLYEMLSGKRAFEGDDITDIIANVVKATPDWKAIPASTPPQVVTLIQRCLEKDQKTRIGDIAVARFLLSSESTIGAVQAATGGAPVRRSIWPTLAIVAVTMIATAAIAWIVSRPQGAAPVITHLRMDVGPAQQLSPSPNSLTRPSQIAVAIAPDGRRVAFAGLKDGQFQLYVRDLDQAAAMPIAGTDGAFSPFFAPDGAWIGFVGEGRIKKVPAGGGPAVVICDLPSGTAFWGASWADDGNVYFGGRLGIFKVKSGGGTPEQVTTADFAKGERHLLPRMLPGSKTLIYTSPPNVVARSIDTGAEHTLIEGGSDARFFAPGHLLFMRTGVLMAVPFDAASQKTTGPPAALLEGVLHAVNTDNANNETLAGQFDVSANGTLIYAEGGAFPVPSSNLVWSDRQGNTHAFADTPPNPYLFPRLSPDGRRVAIVMREANSRSTEVWMFDADRGGTPTRLTFEGGGAPVWSPDSKQLAISSRTLFTLAADGSGKPQPLLSGEFQQTPASWSRTANTIAYMQRPNADSYGIWVLPMQGPNTGKPQLFLQSRFVLTHPALSADGKWIAYVSNESGGTEVYVQGFPNGEKARVSKNGGFEPLWPANGKEILFRTGRSGEQFMSAEVRSLTPLRIDPPHPLFEARIGEYGSTTPVTSWDVSADGKRFLLLKMNPSPDKPIASIHVVLNWTEELKNRVK